MTSLSSSNQHRSSSTSSTATLVVLGATSTMAIGLSLYLWRSVAHLQDRLEVLEAKQQATEERHQQQQLLKSPSSHSHRRLSHSERSVSTSERQVAGSEDEKKGEEDDNIARSLFVFEGGPGEYPPPELVLTADTDELPPRFLGAGKGVEEEGRRRFKATLEWRERHDMDTALYRAWPQFELIKSHYPHFFHCTGHNGEPVFFEQPPRTDLKALRKGGVDLKALLQHYAMICEYQWQMVTRDDRQKSIYIIDLDGMGMYDFVGECQEFVRQASQFASAHYPERAGVVLVINVPYWFKMVWNVVSKWVDEVTLKKIFILRGKEEIYETLADKIPVDNIPKIYGGTSPYELGDSPQERLLRELMSHNNIMAETGVCPNADKAEPCRFCNFRYARNF